MAESEMHRSKTAKSFNVPKETVLKNMNIVSCANYGHSVLAKRSSGYNSTFAKTDKQILNIIIAKQAPVTKSQRNCML